MGAVPTTYHSNNSITVMQSRKEVEHVPIANKNSYRSVSDDSYFTICIVKETVKS